MKTKPNINDFEKLCWLIKIGMDPNHPVLQSLIKSSGVGYDKVKKIVDKLTHKLIDTL